MYFKINKTLIAKFLVIIGSHFAHVISVGMSMSFGILYSEIRSDFGVSQSEASWTASIFLGLLGITGVPLCAIVPYAGERLTTFIGTILLCSGMIASSFVQNYNWFYLTYGVIAGLGGGILHYTGSVVLVKHFHSKWRPFAVAIANAGVSVSALVLPPLMVACNEAYSWRRTFVVLGCISSVGLFSAATFYQPREAEIAAPTDTNIDDNVEKVVNNGTTTGQTLKQQVSEIVHNVDYMTFTLSSVLTLLVVFNPPTFLPDLMLESNIEEYQISWCIMSMGFGSLFGRIICGIVASRCGHVQLIQGVVLFGYATTAILMVFVHSFVPFMILTTLAGAFNGGYFGLLLSVVAHHLKTEQVATGFGMTYTGCGLATIAGMPLAGFVTEYFKSEGGAFIFSGCVMMFATLVLCFIKIRHWFKSKEDKSNNNINDNTFVVINASTHL